MRGPRQRKAHTLGLLYVLDLTCELSYMNGADGSKFYNLIVFMSAVAAFSVMAQRTSSQPALGF